MRVEGVVAAQVQEARIPDHLLARASSNDRAQVVVHALARHALEPLEGARVTLEEGLDRHLEGEEGRLRARVGQRGDERIHAPLAAGELRPGRHLRPVQLHDLPRPVARPLRRPHHRRAQLAQPTADDVD